MYISVCFLFFLAIWSFLLSVVFFFLLCPWDSPGKNTGVGCHALLQGIFPTQRSNLHVLHLTCIGRGGSLPLVPPGKPTVRSSYPQTKKWPCTDTLGLEPWAFPKLLMGTRARCLLPQPFILSIDREPKGTWPRPPHKHPRHGDSQACTIRQPLWWIKKFKN